MKLWLDDMRPAPIGWLHAKTVAEAIELCERNPQVEKMSLDHDLGACLACMQHFTGLNTTDRTTLVEAWLVKSEYQSMPHCVHEKSGHDFVVWLENNPGYCPAEMPNVHSANPVGRDRMRLGLQRLYEALRGT